MNSVVTPINQIGKTVRLLREQRSLAQWELAAKIGVAQSMISLIENGERNPSLEVVVKLAAVFETTIDSLYNGQVPPSLPG
jgi:DNA-binding XRE family transcriptional regulator